MEPENPTSKSVVPRAYQIVEMTKKKKVEKESLNIKRRVVMMMTKMVTTTTIEETLSSDPNSGKSD